MGIQTEGHFSAGDFNQDQKYFLDYHRDKIFLQAKIKR